MDETNKKVLLLLSLNVSLVILHFLVWALLLYLWKEHEIRGREHIFMSFPILAFLFNYRFIDGKKLVIKITKVIFITVIWRWTPKVGQPEGRWTPKTGQGAKLYVRLP